MQGNAPLIWSAISEIKGRKVSYVHFDGKVAKLTTSQNKGCLYRLDGGGFFSALHQTTKLNLVQIFAVGSIVAALAKKISVLIGMRILQAVGSSSVLNVAAGTLAVSYTNPQSGSSDLVP